MLFTIIKLQNNLMSHISKEDEEDTMVDIEYIMI